jgi:hypothetical protein
MERFHLQTDGEKVFLEVKDKKMTLSTQELATFIHQAQNMLYIVAGVQEEAADRKQRLKAMH